MRTFVIYESMFGNTRDVALAIAKGLATRTPVETCEVSAAPSTLPEDVDFVVLGGPTHAHGMTNPKTRADSARRAGDRLVSRGRGIADWIDNLRSVAPGVRAAAFDTRIKGPLLLWGSAARGAAKRLEAVGLGLLEAPQSFLVDGPTGPLFDRLRAGELERATAWGASLGAKIAERRGTPAVANAGR